MAGKDGKCSITHKTLVGSRGVTISNMLHVIGWSQSDEGRRNQTGKPAL